MYLVFTRMPGESYWRWLRSLLLCSSYVFWALINSLVCWFCMRALGLGLFQISVTQLKSSLTSARRMMRLPSGQMMWSTWDLTFSHVRSGVRRLACTKNDTWTTCIDTWPLPPPNWHIHTHLHNTHRFHPHPPRFYTCTCMHARARACTHTQPLSPFLSLSHTHIPLSLSCTHTHTHTHTQAPLRTNKRTEITKNHTIKKEHPIWLKSRKVKSKTDHINFRVGVPHVAHNTACL